MDKKIFDGVDLDLLLKKTVKSAIAQQTATLPKVESLDEAYVAEPKVFKQVSEFVCVSFLNNF